MNNPKLFETNLFLGVNRTETDITLLDLFAGMAMQAIVATPGRADTRETVRTAYHVAQAMLEERDRVMEAMEGAKS